MSTKKLDYTTQHLITTAELADLLGLTEQTIHRRRWRGTGPPYIKMGPKDVRYLASDVHDWMAANRVVPVRSIGYGHHRPPE